ncbi:MAG: RagB/SusD family nutrient uptake outer membrane protein [Candidatus Pseudobacter hemicellulosilyticus]|uniref:RagB/SusD family nutrient uptake outer membrane protein n=1 Tax=Candidatus Pseudobacter hemicellulosilyticus TaxID=3121375 RepID=A0AAJ6BFX5_9BACT|nr:MAG: RagB/SusD family nutrient uptake outer membrane protein [Pseudobacter sp.]
MKTLQYMVAGLLLLASASSCKKGWLDVTPSNQIKAEDQFNSEAGFKDALMGVYIGMTASELYGRDMSWNLPDLMAQQYNALQEGSRDYDIQLYNYRTIRSIPKVEAFWNKTYNLIANTNSALEYIDKNRSVLNPVSYSIIKGELLGLRAFLHFDLLRLFGYGNLANRPELSGKQAIPYVTVLSKDMTAQRSFPETFALLQKDINEAIELLKEDPITGNHASSYYAVVNRDGFYNNRQQRMNYYAVKALQARAYLWQGGAANLAAAAAVAEEVISQSPAELISVDNSPSTDKFFQPEHLFTLNVSAFINIINPSLVAVLATDVNALFLQTATAESLYEANTAGIGNVDKRFNTMLSSQPRGYISVKLRQEDRSFTTNNLMPLIRVAEMYYIAAENYIETDLPKAIEYLNTVRRSRGIQVDIPAIADKATVVAELQKEYRKDFLMEGQLFFYYKRLNLSTFPGFPANRVANDQVYVLPYPNSELEAGNRVQ